MPGPRPTPRSHYYWSDPRTLLLFAAIAILIGIIVYVFIR
jgi:hypothetical protein